MITSTKNPRIVQARKLTQRKHRLRQNCFLVEGLQLLSLAAQTMDSSPAVRPKIKPREIFYSQPLFTGKTAPRLLGLLSAAGGEAVPVAPNVLDSLSQRDTAQGLVATFALRQLEWPIDELVPLAALPPGPSRPDLILILDRLQDPGNLGTLIRTGDAVGARAAILLEPCVDPFDPKTVRATMGSIFTVPFSRTKNIDDILPRLSKLGYHLVGADANRGQVAWQSNVLAGPVALVLGNEARGLSPELHAHLAGYVNLPLRGQAESLNVSVAGGVLMYEWLRANSNSLEQGVTL